jgi:hypothetical protein
MGHSLRENYDTGDGYKIKNMKGNKIYWFVIDTVTPAVRDCKQAKHILTKLTYNIIRIRGVW